ncbi:MAG: serine/threonine-protein kinase [Acidobacteriota bacterium]
MVRKMAPPIVDLDFHHPTPNGPGGTAVESAIGPYDLLSTLGRGGMGHVHRARHRESGAIVALKTVRAAEASHLASIRREIHSLARLRHPGIVRVVDEGLERGMPWYAMELCEGATLRDLVPGVEDFGTDVGPELVRVVTLIARLCASLAYLHGEGLVHRDLKPENVMVRSGDAPLLVDFGIASAFTGRSGRDVLWLDSDVVGTPAYMAPEQALGKAVDARGDLYALGCMLHELLTGAPPFSDGSAGEVLRMHLDVAPSPPSRLRGGIPPELDDLVLRLLAKEPAERLGHADDVAARLRALGASGDDTALPPARTAASTVPLLRGDARRDGRPRARPEPARRHRRDLASRRRERRRRTRLLSRSRRRRAPRTSASFRAVPPSRRTTPLVICASRCSRSPTAAARRAAPSRSASSAAVEAARTLRAEPRHITWTGGAPRSQPSCRPTRRSSLSTRTRGGRARRPRPPRPVVLVLDDLHWADDLVISFLGRGPLAGDALVPRARRIPGPRRGRRISVLC